MPRLSFAEAIAGGMKKDSLRPLLERETRPDNLIRI
jgi:hypothetical protein